MKRKKTIRYLFAALVIAASLTVVAKNQLSAINENGSVASRPRVVKTLFETPDVVIASYDVMDFNAGRDGKTDDTKAIQAAIDAAFNDGGGVVFLPPGFYAVRGRLAIQPGVTLRGDWNNPERFDEKREENPGTVLMVFADRGKADGDAFISILNNAGIRDMTIWYPEQRFDQIEAYPFTIRQVGKYSATIDNLTLVNSYQGIEIGPGSNSLAILRNIYVTALRKGIVRDNTWDVARMQNLQFSPRFWSQSGFPGSPDSTDKKHRLENWMEENGEAVVVRFPAWTWFYNLTIEHYRTGIMTLPSAVHQLKGPNGGVFNLHIADCRTGIHLGDNAAPGFFVTGGTIDTKGPNSIGIFADESFNSTAQFNSIMISGATAVKAENNKKGALTFLHSLFESYGEEYTVDIHGGAVEILQSHFSPDKKHIRLKDDIKMAYIAGNTFSAKPDILNQSSDPSVITISHQALNLDKPNLERFVWKCHAPKPASSLLFNIRDFGALGDGKNNDAPAIQKALDRARKKGGTVYAPPGDYVLQNELLVPTGVELRGSFDGPHHTSDHSGAHFIVRTGKNQPDGIPLIRLEKNSGIKGLSIYYPDQVWNTTSYIPYPWTIQGLGPGVWVKDMVLVNPYQGIDFATFDSRGHFIDYVAGSPLVTGVYLSNNAGEGWSQNIQFIPHYWARSTYENKPDRGETLRANTQKSLTGIKYGYNANERMLQNFVYGAHFGIRYIHQENMGGSSGISMAQGVDGSEIALCVDGGEDLEFINTQLVPLGESDQKRTILVSKSFSGTARFFNSIFWGQPERSVEIESGKLVFQQTNHTAKQGDAAFYITGGSAALTANRFSDPGINIFIGSGASVEVIGPITTTKYHSKHVYRESGVD